MDSSPASPHRMITRQCTRRLLLASIASIVWLIPAVTLADTAFNGSITKSGPATVAAGGVIVETVTVTSFSGPTSYLIINDPVPAGLTYVPSQSSNLNCTLTSGAVRCTPVATACLGVSKPNCDYTPKITVTYTIAFQVPATATCGTTYSNQATIISPSSSNPNSNVVTTTVSCPSSSSSSSSSVSSSTSSSLSSSSSSGSSLSSSSSSTSSSAVSSSSSSVAVGCIDIVKETYNTQGQIMTPVTQFSFQVDFASTVQNAGNGQVRISNVLPGAHVLLETAATNWTLLSASPDLGIVTVQPGASCAVVTFKNQQTIPPPDLTVTKTGPSSIVRGNSIVYILNVRNNGTTSASNTVLTDPIPAGLVFNANSSDGSCTQIGTDVVCGLGSLNGGLTRTVRLSFTAPAVSQCNTVTVSNQASVSTTTSESDTSNNTSAVVSTRIDCPASQIGCIQIVKQALSSTGATVRPVPAFLFQLDGGATTQNDTSGNGGFVNVSTGTHTVTETGSVAGWTLESVTPAGGAVTVQSGTQCTLVTFRNRQSSNASSSSSSSVSSVSSASSSVSSVSSSTSSLSSLSSLSSSSSVSSVSSSSSSTPTVGCIQILEQAFNPSGTQLSITPQFSFRLDNGATVANDVNGSAQYQNVPVGTHTVTQTVPSGWTTLSVSPSGGIVIVTGGACNGVTFKNQQTAVASASSSSVSTPLYPSVYTYPLYPSYSYTPQPQFVAYNHGIGSAQTTCTLTISQSADRSEAQSGDVVRFAVTVGNAGTRSANGVIVRDTLEAGMIVVDPAGGNVSGNQLTWDIGTLPVGAQRSISYVLRVGAMLSNGQSVWNAVSAQSPDCGSTEASTVVGIINQLPQTGFFGSFVKTGSPFLTKIRAADGTTESGSGTGAWLLLFGLLSVGSGIGGFLLQRKKF